MKRITKTEAKQFTAALQTAALEMGFRPFIPDPSGHGRYEGAMWIMTDWGRYLLHDADTERGSVHFWIYGRFLEPARLPRTRRDTPSFDWNPFSGKFNFWGSSPDEAVGKFRVALDIANARPATPEEIAEYDAADLAEYTKRAAYRKEGV